MALELTEDITIKITKQGKTEEYKVTAYLTMDPDRKTSFDAFREEMQKKNKPMEEAIERGAFLSKKLSRIGEDIEDINEELTEVDDGKQRKKLIKERRSLRKIYRETEDALEAHNKAHDIASYKKKLQDIAEEISKKSFEVNIADTDNKALLEEAINRYNVSYTMIIGEITRLIEDARKKKKKHS